MNILKAAALFAGAVEELKRQSDAMEKVGALIETSAKNAIGSYEFGWPALKPETVARKSTGDSPLLETGELRDSISHTVLSHNHVVIGTNDPKAAYHEYGTSKIPPRPFLWGAWVHKVDEVKEIVGHAAFGKLIAKR